MRWLKRRRLHEERPRRRRRDHLLGAGLFGAGQLRGAGVRSRGVPRISQSMRAIESRTPLWSLNRLTIRCGLAAREAICSRPGAFSRCIGRAVHRRSRTTVTTHRAIVPIPCDPSLDGCYGRRNSPQCPSGSGASNHRGLRNAPAQANYLTPGIGKPRRTLYGPVTRRR